MGKTLYCCVQSCGYKRSTIVREEPTSARPLYRFPNNPELKEKWLQALINLNSQSDVLKLPKKAYVCAKHFAPACMHKIGFSAIRLKSGSVPTIFPLKKTIQLEQDITEESNIISDEPLDLKPIEIIKDPLGEPCWSNNVRYPGDINERNVKGMTKESLQKSILLLKQACLKKDQKIKRLQSSSNRQKKKIESLQSMV
ncbi:hypothetical protein ABEB36_003878 [Hypothenemus hampei]|uniref:THAP-type domain-containing protein n=1 Tax=Hypothenemus hampei TaxID=57062 RepID=A0ABD1F443_HYPHA